MSNVVELLADDDDDMGFDQPCKFGHHIKDHSVYCHSENKDMPRKCWKNTTTNRHQDCAGFEPNTQPQGTPFNG